MNKYNYIILCNLIGCLMILNPAFCNLIESHIKIKYSNFILQRGGWLKMMHAGRLRQQTLNNQ